MKEFFEVFTIFAVTMILAVFLMVGIGRFARAQEITPLPCPPVTSWILKAPLLEFKTLCGDNVQFTEEAIIVPTACPFKVSVVGSEDNPWVAVSCEMILKFYKDKGAT